VEEVEALLKERLTLFQQFGRSKSASAAGVSPHAPLPQDVQDRLEKTRARDALIKRTLKVIAPVLVLVFLFFPLSVFLLNEFFSQNTHHEPGEAVETQLSDEESERQNIRPTPLPGESLRLLDLATLDCDVEEKGTECSLPRNFRNYVGMEFALIPSGEFWMGCNRKDEESGSERCINNAQPLHRVVISRPFYMSRTEVTQEQWASIMGEVPLHNSSGMTPAPRHHPVEHVSWNDAQEFLKKLNAHDPERLYRLPSEAEWEYACRAGSRKDYSFGNDEEQLRQYAWYQETATEYTTQPVARKMPNAFGLYDMHGNVAEWVQDSYMNEYIDGPNDESPRTSRDSVQKVQRGGAFHSAPFSLTCSSRSRSDADERSRYDGFRIVAEILH
jgi:formylglycine-generating enzyme required for sulfatase activity